MKSKSSSRRSSKRPLTGLPPEPYSKHRYVEEGVDWCWDTNDIVYIDGVLHFVTLDVQPLATVVEVEYPVLYTDLAGTTFLYPPSKNRNNDHREMNLDDCTDENYPVDYTLEPSIGIIDSRALSEAAPFKTRSSRASSWSSKPVRQG
ncbi:hypothetical protein CDL15_Pgr028103 [Punica granatum]|uniref:Uncharacterized protein n=1 Tax=Punica granatum TaxID=22663 RepID=A0A218XKU8_PUNGR|nr:hypothetical protein CDL15_Pgr028103 [Punica granatum]PKI50959.1 hypothetical protein CRG98_028689 [Punica granatum]